MFEASDSMCGIYDSGAKRLMHFVLTFVVVAYAVMIIAAWKSDALIFQPQPSSYSVSSIPAPFQVVRLQSGSGEKQETITAVYLPNASARFTLLMSHGNARYWEKTWRFIKSMRGAALPCSRMTIAGTGLRMGVRARAAYIRTRRLHGSI